MGLRPLLLALVACLLISACLAESQDAAKTGHKKLRHLHKARQEKKTLNSATKPPASSAKSAGRHSSAHSSTSSPSLLQTPVVFMPDVPPHFPPPPSPLFIRHPSSVPFGALPSLTRIAPLRPAMPHVDPAEALAKISKDDTTPVQLVSPPLPPANPDQIRLDRETLVALDERIQEKQEALNKHDEWLADANDTLNKLNSQITDTASTKATLDQDVANLHKKKDATERMIQRDILERDLRAYQTQLQYWQQNADKARVQKDNLSKSSSELERNIQAIQKKLEKLGVEDVDSLVEEARRDDNDGELTELLGTTSVSSANSASDVTATTATAPTEAASPPALPPALR